MYGDYPSLTPSELTAAGRSLFGPDWRLGMARRLQVDEQHVTAAATGAVPVPREWRGRLIGIAQDIALSALAAATELTPEAPGNAGGLRVHPAGRIPA